MKKFMALTVCLAVLFGAAAAQNSVKLEVNKVNVEPAPLQTSEYADVWLEVVNKGSTDARDVNLEFKEDYPFTVDPDEKTDWDLGRLVPGEEYMIHLETRVDDNAIQGENELVFETSTGPETSIQHKVPVEVRSDNDILSFSKVDFPENVASGSTSQMSMELENLADGQLKNVEVEMDFSKVPIAASGTSSRTLRKVESGASRSIEFDLNVDETAENGVYRIPVEASYENEAGNSFTRDTTVGVVVGGEPELEAGLNSVEEEFTPGSTGTVTVRLVNRGHGSADFVRMELQQSEKYEILSPNSVYIGDMDADDYQTAEFRLNIDSEAENVSLPLEVSYTGMEGEEVDQQNVELPVYTREELERYGLASGGSMLPIVVVILLIVGAVYYWRRRKRE